MNSIVNLTFLQIFLFLLIAKKTTGQNLTTIANTTEADVSTLPGNVTIPDATTITTITENSTNPSPTQPDVTTSVPSTPAPNSPPLNTYTVTGENGTCILLQAGIQFQITYLNIHKENVSEILGVPDVGRITYSGDCNHDNDTQTIQILFYEGWNLTMEFSETADGDIQKFYMSSIELTANLTVELFPDIYTPEYIKDIANTFEKTEIAASVDGSYQCTSEAIFAFQQQSFMMNTFYLQYVAFQHNTTSFSDSGITQCSGDITTVAYIPIAVGSSLGGLILIVLIVYIIGRKCEKKSAYETI